MARPLLTNYLLKNDYQTEPNSIVNIFSSNCLEKCSLCNRNKEPESLNHKPVVSLYYEAKKIKKYKLKKGSRVSYNLQNSLTQNLFQTNVNTSHGLNSQSLQREVQDGNFQEPNLNPAGESVIQETDSEIKNTTSIALFQPNNLNLDAEKSRTQNDQGKTKAFSSVSELSNPSNLESENNIIDRPIALITPMLQPNESVSDRAERGGELLILEDSFSKESSSILDFLEDSEPMLDLQVEESTRSKEQNETLAEKNKNTTQTTIVCAINQRIQNFTADGKNLKHQPSQSQLVSDSDEAHQDFMLVGWQKKRQDANIQDFFISSREQDISTNGIELQTEELLLGTSAELDLDFHNSENSFSRTAAYGAWKRGSLHFSSIFVHENKTDRRQSKNNERLIHSVTEIGYHVEKPNILFGSFLILSGFSSNREESFQKKGLGFRIAGPLSSTDSSANIEYEFAIQHMFSAFGSEQEITGLIKLETESGANFAVAYKNSLESTETGLRLNIKF